MVDKKLLDYIISVRGQGYDDNAIKENLAKYGYDKKNIDEAFSQLLESITKQDAKEEKVVVKEGSSLLKLFVILFAIIIICAGAFAVYTMVLPQFETHPECADVSLEIYDLGEGPILCAYPDYSQVQIIFENKGGKMIDQADIIIHGPGKTKKYPLDVELAKGDIYTWLQKLNGEFKSIDRIAILPKIQVDGKVLQCRDKELVVDEVPSCRI